MQPICFNTIPSAAYQQAVASQRPVLAQVLPNGVVVVVQPTGAQNNIVNEAQARITFPNLQLLS